MTVLNMDNSEEIEMKRINKRIKSPGLRKCLMDTFEDYCQHTSLSGLQYVGDRNRPIKERLFWLCVFLVSICCCVYSVHRVYTKWSDTPVIVTFSERSTPVWSIPFPAVTICSETKRELELNYTNTYADLEKLFNNSTNEIFEPQNVTAEEMEEFRAMLHVCGPQDVPEKSPRIPGDILDYNEVLDRILPSLNDSLHFCNFLNKFDECDKYFRKTLTEEGICYTYNGLAFTDIFREDTYQYQYPNALENQTRSSWSLEKGYAASSKKETFPARVLSSGLRSALQVVLHSLTQDVDYGCRGAVQGYKVILHSPEDVPHVSQQFARIPLDQEVLIAVKPNMITTSDGIAQYDAKKRQCFLSHERYLRFFKIYSESNCQMECMANFTLNKCGCVKFSMPRTLDTPVCDESKIYCYTQAEHELLESEFNRATNQGDNPTGVEGSACRCLPSCTSLIYNTEISQAKFELKKLLNAYDNNGFDKEFGDAQLSSLYIYFKQNQFITSKRSEIYGFTEFLGNCGGIFGLFVSFSILSLVELIYYFTLRLWTNLKQTHKVNQH